MALLVELSAPLAAASFLTHKHHQHRRERRVKVKKKIKNVSHCSVFSMRLKRSEMGVFCPP